MNSAYTNSKLRHSIETGFDGTGSGRTSEGLLEILAIGTVLCYVWNQVN
jgi:hypothetical protein